RAPIQWALSSPAPGRLERAFSARTSFAGGRCPLSSQIVSLPFASRHKRAPVRPSWAAATPATCLASSEESASPGSSPGVSLWAGGPTWPGTGATPELAATNWAAPFAVIRVVLGSDRSLGFCFEYANLTAPPASRQQT